MIDRVGVEAGLAQQRLLRRRELRGRGRQAAGEDRQQEDQMSYHPLGQAEEEAASLARRALGLERADGEELAEFAVMVDDALAVHEAETMGSARRGDGLGRDLLVADGLIFEEVGHLVLRHSAARVLHAHLHVVAGFLGRDPHRAPSSVYLRALSIRVLTMKSVSTRSAFTQAPVGSTLRRIAFIRNSG